MIHGRHPQFPAPRRLTAFAALALFAALATGAGAAEPFHQAELIFPMEHWHNHGSAVVECPNGDLLVCWFHGSGERTADDCRINGARWIKAENRWTEPFVMADTPDFPDTNCTMIIDPQERLWLFWPAILANTWESALMQYKIALPAEYQSPEGPPKWSTEKVMLMKPPPDFAEVVKRKMDEHLGKLAGTFIGKKWTDHNLKLASDKLTTRLGWFTRAHPVILDGTRMVVGLYSDGFSFSAAAYTDNWGDSWTFSDPIVGGGAVQPSFARRKDGTLVTFMRDNGPPPKKALIAESTDRGATWSKVEDHPTVLNSGSGIEVMNLADGRWLLINNDLADGRHSLAMAISADEGRSFPVVRHLELVPKGEGSFSYPSIVQGRDGMIHATYSYSLESVPDGSKNRKSIKHAKFNLEWVEAGDPVQ